ncbi:MAG: ATP-binding protein [Acidobacteria bacterium]|nr:ATP-binding protein [Acidobacteriota bacterium]
MQRKFLLSVNTTTSRRRSKRCLAVGHTVKIVENRIDAMSITNMEGYDLVITDLDVRPGDQASVNVNEPVCLPDFPAFSSKEHVKAFKLCASNYRRDNFDEEELKHLVATVLDYKIRFVDTVDSVADLHENIEFELPSAVSTMHIVLRIFDEAGQAQRHQTRRIEPLRLALDEAFINAVKHGNQFDSQKLVRITAEVTKAEAKFHHRGRRRGGFDVNSIPDPLDPENLFKNQRPRRPVYLQHHGRGQIATVEIG